MSSLASMRRVLGAVATLSALAALPTPARSQSAPPGTDIYLAPITITPSGIRIGKPVDITHRAGYDNEPAFTPSGAAVLYASVRGDGQADIYRYDVASAATTRLTSTPESEYSPTPMPGEQRFSAVRVERDSAQRLWSFRMDGSVPELLFPGIAPVGYHAWVDSGTVVLYVLGKPNTLEVVDRATGAREVVAHDVGRSLQHVPGRREVSFLQHERDGSWSLRLLDLAHSVAGMRVVVKLATMPPRSDYVAWLPNGTVLTAQDGKLLARRGRQWVSVADLGRWGLRGISRLAVSDDGKWLAIVAPDE